MISRVEAATVLLTADPTRTYQEIANELGYTRQAVQLIAKRIGITRDDRRAKIQAEAAEAAERKRDARSGKTISISPTKDSRFVASASWCAHAARCRNARIIARALVARNARQ
jgi:hypothetical protein